MNSLPPRKNSDAGRYRQLIKRIGIWGMLFFLVKGILWLTIPALLVYPGIN